MNLQRIVSFLGLAVLLVGCARSAISDRDARLNQLRNQAEIKRKEFQQVVGDYTGLLKLSESDSRNVTLRVETKDIPITVEGFVDPVLMPTLTGYLRFELGGEANYIPFGITKAEYDPKRRSIDIVASNDKYKDLIMGLTLSENWLAGSWTAPGIGASGTAKLERNGTKPPEAEALGGEYAGILWRENNKYYQFAHVTLRTTNQPPEGLKVSAVLRIIFGDWKSTEYLTFKFDNIAYNPLDGQLVLRGDNSDVTFQGTASSGKIQGIWSSSFTGKLGGAQFVKSTEAPKIPPEGELFEALMGTYRGKLTNVSSQSNLPEKNQISFVTSQDLNEPSGVKVTGKIRFYYGSFEGLEFYEDTFENVQYNFFTRQLVAKTTKEKLTVKGKLENGKLFAQLFSDALGYVSDIEVTKQ